MAERPRVVGIYSSPRQGGNSDTLLDAVLDGAASAGAAVEPLYLRELGIEGCRNCGGCSRSGRCVIDDGMTAIYDALDHADVVVLASPIYFCSLCSQAKAMIDRCQPYWARKYVLKQEPPLPGRRGGFVCCCGFKDDRFLKCTEQIVKTLYFVMGSQYVGCLFVPGLDSRGDAAKHPSALDEARAYGQRLISGG